MKNSKRWVISKRTFSNILVVLVGVLLYLGLSNFGALWERARWFLGVISPFTIAVAIAYLINIPMRFVETRLLAKVRHKRGLALLITYVVCLLVVGWLLGLVLPQVAQSAVSLVRNVPAYLDNLGDLVNWISTTFYIEPENLDFILLSYTDIVTSLMEWGRDMLPNLVNVTMQIGSGIVSLLTALIASIYMLASKEKLQRQGKKLLYALLPARRADSVTHVLSLSNGVFSGFISGKFLDSAIIGAMCFVFMWIAKMPFAVLISVVIGVTNIIPFFGPFIGAIPSAMILLLVDPWKALWFIIFIIALQQFDGNFLGPRILGSSTGLPALWVLVAIVVGGGLFGFAGMLLGVPTAAVLYTLSSNFINTRLEKKGVTDVNSPPGDNDGQAPALDTPQAPSAEGEATGSEQAADAPAPEKK